VTAAETREPTPEEAHKLRRLGEPVIATLTTDAGSILDVAAAGQVEGLLLGPFAPSPPRAGSHVTPSATSGPALA
jgi:hypothetical protein